MAVAPRGEDPAAAFARLAEVSERLRDELGWQPRYRDFRSGLAATIDWYRAHEEWWRPQKSATEARYARSEKVL